MIYRVVECEDKLDQEITNKNITDDNLFKYMGNIDQRVNEILQGQLYIQSKNNEGDAPVYDHVNGVYHSQPQKDINQIIKQTERKEDLIMMPGIFQHIGKIGSDEPSPQDTNEDTDEDEEFAKSRTVVKRRNSSIFNSAVKTRRNVTQVVQELESSDPDDDKENNGDNDLDFNGRMGYADFMKQFQSNQSGVR